VLGFIHAGHEESECLLIRDCKRLQQQLPSFLATSQVLEIHKHFNLSPNKESHRWKFYQGFILVWQDKVQRSGGKNEKHFLLPMQKK
jgi:hypothetical protein